MLFQKCVVYTKAMTYHLPCNKSNTTGGRCGAGTTYPSRTPAFSPVFICISSSCVVHVVKLNVFVFLVTCCDIGYDFHIRRCPVPLGYHVFCRGFVLCSCYLYLFTYTVVQHDFHIRRCPVPLGYHVFCRGFVLCSCYLYLFTHTVVQHDVHIRRCPVPLGYHVFCRGFVLCSCYLYLFTYTVVQHDFHSI